MSGMTWNADWEGGGMRLNCLFETAVVLKSWRKVGSGLEVYFLSCF